MKEQAKACLATLLVAQTLNTQKELVTHAWGPSGRHIAQTGYTAPKESQPVLQRLSFARHSISTAPKLEAMIRPFLELAQLGVPDWPLVIASTAVVCSGPTASFWQIKLAMSTPWTGWHLQWLMPVILEEQFTPMLTSSETLSRSQACKVHHGTNSCPPLGHRPLDCTNLLCLWKVIFSSPVQSRKNSELSSILKHMKHPLCEEIKFRRIQVTIHVLQCSQLKSWKSCHNSCCVFSMILHDLPAIRHASLTKKTTDITGL